MENKGRYKMRFFSKKFICLVLVTSILTATVFHCCLPTVAMAMQDDRMEDHRVVFSSQQEILPLQSSHGCCNPNPINFFNAKISKDSKAVSFIFEYAKKICPLDNIIPEILVPKIVFFNDESPPRALQKSVPIYLFDRVLRL